MISLIISSQSSDLLTAVKKNIEDTIGVAYEIIATPNKNGQYSIFEAYNIGAAQASFPYLVFIHEDVQFVTPGWGERLVKHFQELPHVGIIGLAGSKYLSKLPSGWFLECLTQRYIRMNYLQGFESFNNPDKRTINPDKLLADEVVVLDGVFLAVRKEVWDEFRFDEKTFKGFHFYDLDFCLQVGSACKNYVVFDIELIHASEGSYNQIWIEQAIKFHNKWSHLLPRYTKLEQAAHGTKLEWTQFFKWIKLVRLHSSYIKTFSWAYKYAPFSNVALREYVKFHYYLFAVFPFKKNCFKND